MNKVLTSLLCAWICCWLVVAPTISYAQEAAPEPTPIKVNDPAPFSGVLIPTIQAADMVARLEQQGQVCQGRVDTEVAAAVNVIDLRLNNCISSKAVMEEMYTSQLVANRDYIDFLEKKAMGPRIPQEWVFIIGIVAGAGIAIGAGYAMHEAASH
jgi:hypothetical protein|tara:strand:- start:2582 stop:3046 length:465 start_codon:yes stop_codon:yes gene_type:complete